MRICPGGGHRPLIETKGAYPNMKNLMKRFAAIFAIIGEGNRKNDGIL